MSDLLGGRIWQFAVCVNYVFIVSNLHSTCGSRARSSDRPGLGAGVCCLHGAAWRLGSHCIGLQPREPVPGEVPGSAQGAEPGVAGTLQPGGPDSLCSVGKSPTLPPFSNG